MLTIEAVRKLWNGALFALSPGTLPDGLPRIDRYFTARPGVKPEDAAVVSAVIDLAHSSGWEMTAKGAETADRLARLRELG